MTSIVTIFCCYKPRLTDWHQTSQSSAVPNYSLQTDIKRHNLQLFHTTIYRLISNVIIISSSKLRFIEWHQWHLHHFETTGLLTNFERHNCQLFQTTVNRLISNVIIFCCSKLRFLDWHQTSQSLAVPNYGLQTDIIDLNLQLFETTFYRLTSNVIIVSCSKVRFTNWHQTSQTSAVWKLLFTDDIKRHNRQ